MLSDFWRDLIAIASLVLTTAGLIYAIIQIRKTQSAVEAARDAAKKTLGDIQTSFQKYAAANAHRFVSEVRIFIDTAEWDKAALRASDIADQAAQLSAFDSEWQAFTEELRTLATTCKRLSQGELLQFPQTKWNRLAKRLQTKIDSYHGPFRGTSG